jgi:Zn-dependent peptidase ImmA (M78 family)
MNHNINIQTEEAMNTVKVGDKFENESYLLIQQGIERGDFGISEANAKVFRKKGYYSKDREKEIVFDLSIEVWPPNAEKYSLLFIVECKSSPSGNKVPVDDIEELYSKISQVAGGGVKGVMITDSSFQSGGLTFAKNKNIMLIEVDKDGNQSIVLHRTDRSGNKRAEIGKDIIEKFEKFIKKTLGIQKVEGLEYLSADQIELKTLEILKDYNNLTSSIRLTPFLKFVQESYEVSFDVNTTLGSIDGKKIKGYFDVERNVIFIDESVVDNDEYPFLVGHELGHFFLHKNLRLNQEQYNDFKDSSYDFRLGKHNLKNDRNWIEWQANRFSASLFLPKPLLVSRMTEHRRSLGISKPHRIYLDDQAINVRDFRQTLDYLSNYFGISKTAVVYRLEELRLIEYAKPREDMRSLIGEALGGSLYE